MEYVPDIILANPGGLSRLSLHDASCDFLGLLLNLPPHSFAFLEYFSIALLDHLSLTLSDTTTSLETAPNLRSVVCYANSTIYIPEMFYLPWAQLTTLYVTTMALSPMVVHRLCRTVSY